MRKGRTKSGLRLDARRLRGRPAADGAERWRGMGSQEKGGRGEGERGEEGKEGPVSERISHAGWHGRMPISKGGWHGSSLAWNIPFQSNPSQHVSQAQHRLSACLLAKERVTDGECDAQQGRRGPMRGAGHVRRARRPWPG